MHRLPPVTFGPPGDGALPMRGGRRCVDDQNAAAAGSIAAPTAAAARLASARLGARVTVVLVLTLALVTWLGTLAAASDGVMAAQMRYFDTYLAWVDLPFGLSLPLPGARLLLWLLLAALLLNRAAWLPGRGRGSVVGVHAGVAALLAGAVLAPPTQVVGHLWLERGVPARSVHGADGSDVPLPFALRLHDHARRFHPGTGVLAAVQARVEVLVEGRPSQTVDIASNRPLRRDGLAVYLPATPAETPTDLGALHLIVARSGGRTALVAVSAFLAGALAWHFARTLWRQARAAEAPRACELSESSRRSCR